MSIPDTHLGGVISVAKPRGPTSRDIVDRIERLILPKKVGHAGTLDPLASGVLVLCIGTGTRLVQYVQRLPKEYLAEFQLGVCSPTDDIEGELSPAAGPTRVPERREIEAALPGFLGPQLQVPPDYSAVKINGRRAYTLARTRKNLQLEPRPVVVHKIELLKFDYPHLKLSIHCGSGTYIRALGRDIAGSLGTSAVMTSLVRAAVGPFRLENSRDFDQLLTQEDLLSTMLPLSFAAASLASIRLTDDQCRRILQGRPLLRDEFPESDAEELAALDPQGRLIAVVTTDDDWIRPKICLFGPPPPLSTH
ncbi:MAG: tRNA pseudouridine(55) synthase TruB [Planctomycetota bacterium]|nr:tRNA pseudouridine(55) synthase TruB [Planctomycetota bacterium]MDA1178920.1 tRNA pseudouridine(55) synthase TruB [Planctomycetota bacterium]